MTYTGRFAPSPTGPLHAGSLVAALASWLDAKAHGGRWLVRIEDIDAPRCSPESARLILSQLATLLLKPDAPPTYQSQRTLGYQQALEQLILQKQAYPCGCSRQDIARVLAEQRPTPKPARHSETIYPGTCRNGLHGRSPRSWRFLTQQPRNKNSASLDSKNQIAMYSIANQEGNELFWNDRWLGQQHQNVGQEVGDFVLKRADNQWAYQLAVVVDDAAQGVTDVVRGQDLANNTARQIKLQQALRLPTQRYLHVPLVLGLDGEKLSKQNGAQALDLAHPVQTLAAAGQVLGLHIQASSCSDYLAQAVAQWEQRHPIRA